MALKKIAVAAPSAEVKGKSNIVTVPVAPGEKDRDNDLVARYVTAYEDVKTAEGLVKELRPRLLALGQPALFQLNKGKNAEPASSIKLTDSTGAQVRVTMQDKYSTFTEAGVEPLVAILESPLMGVKDPNNYLVETLAAKFDDSIFTVDGNFSQARYDAIKAAMDTVAAKLKIPSPLTVTKVVRLKDDFHVRRNVDFTPEQNLTLAEYAKQTITLLPVVD
jgi:hypothetical protein